ncbi:MAG TPA: poly-beta-1,6-N-acetyl-D-glucosamine synthase [Pseudomonadales bacterium]
MDYSYPLRLLQDFAFLYPLFMAYLWMVGGLAYYFHWERQGRERIDQPPDLAEYPGVSIIVPAHNEGPNILETAASLLEQRYPQFEVIFVNDGSSDDTAEILNDLARNHPRLRVIHLETNQGKGAAMRVGAIAAQHEFLVCIDGDALLDPHAVHWLIRHFLGSPRVGAVTGNPRLRTRSTLLGKIQVGEFSSIIGLIKRAQRIYGRVFTVSGVVAAFRKAALHRVGYWDLDMVTDDIDISWKLQLDHWSIRFESNALCWILMPETVRGLWRQRLRWAQGGVEVIIKYFPVLVRWRKRHMWPVFLEFFASVFWAYTMVGIGLSVLIGQIADLPSMPDISTWLPSWSGVLLGVTCLLQFAVSLTIDSRYERGIWKYYFWVIWYPLAYWLFIMLTAVVAVPKAILKRKGTRAIWTSPDRGEQFYATSDH